MAFEKGLLYQEFYDGDEDGVGNESGGRAEGIIIVFVNGAQVIVLAYLALGNSFYFL